MSSPIRNQENRFPSFYSPSNSPNSSPIKPLSTSLIPGAIASPPRRSSPRLKRLQSAREARPLSHHSSPKHNHDVHSTLKESPLRRSLQDLALRTTRVRVVPGNNVQLSPDSKSAHNSIKKLPTRHRFNPRNLTEKILEAAKEKCENPKPNPNGLFAKVMACPLVNPERANTSVYPEGSEALAEHAKQMRSIARVKANSISDIRSIGGAKDLFIQHKIAMAHDHKERQIERHARRERLVAAVLNQEVHYEGWAHPDKPQGERIMTTAQLENVEPSLFETL